MATRNRYARFFNKKTNAAVQSQASLPAHSSSTLTKSVSYSSLAANLSQVLMLAVVVVGYVYTVRPVFQKEVISEDLARLQIDQRKLQQQMEKQTDSLLAGEAKNRALADERSSIEGQILVLNQKIAASEKSERDAKARAQKAAAEAMTAESTLARLQSQHYNLKLSSLLGQQELPSNLGLMLQRTWQSLSVDIFDEKAPDAVAQKLKSTQVQPLDLANSTLKQLEASAAKHSRDPGGSSDALLAQNYKKGITEHAAELTCPSPPYEQWQVAFQSALSETSQPIRTCIDEAFKQRAIREGWNPSQVESLQKSDFWKQQEGSYRVSCEFSHVYTVKIAFDDAWKAADEPCEERRISVNDIVMGSPVVKKLKVLSIHLPPTPDELTRKVKAQADKATEGDRRYE